MKTEQSDWTGIYCLLGRIVSRVAGAADIFVGQKSDRHASGSAKDELTSLFPEYQGIPRNKGVIQALNWLKNRTTRI